MESITLRRVLPRVFRGSETEPPLSGSEIWLRPEIVFRKPERYIIEAESGTGKSSLCSFIYGARTDFDGDILMDGVSVKDFDMSHWSELRRNALAYLPQEMRLFPELTVMENILIKNNLTHCKTEAAIVGMLKRVGLSGKVSEKAGRLSVGQQQRVAIVRALCQPFDFLLVDEPVSHLDARNNTTIATLIAEEADSRGAAVIATSVGNKLSLTDFKLMHL
ncbi:MAG: ATP-binding cassette domain-containing protein [Muribaculaceae bacterium]|nr:ATP-binding cassette domain-containing protein [Muribaculaceae bacterium]